MERSAKDGERLTMVSICVPAFNAAEFLAETIDSVLAQSVSDWELIVSDNNSSDQTLAIARSYDHPRIRVVTTDITLPMSESWNRALSFATAPYVKLLCADDLLYPHCLEHQISVLEENPDVALTAARRDFIDEAGTEVAVGRGLDALTGKHKSAEVVHRVAELGTNPIGCPSAVLCRREILELAGAFDGDFPAVMDLDLSLRVLEHGDFYGSEESLSLFRISRESATATLAGQGDQYRRWLSRLKSNPVSAVSMETLRSGRRRSRIEDIKRVLLYWATNSRLPGLSHIPKLIMPPPKNSPTRPASKQATV